jgi:hypothetical protein
MTYVFKLNVYLVNVKLLFFIFKRINLLVSDTMKYRKKCYFDVKNTIHKLDLNKREKLSLKVINNT